MRFNSGVLLAACAAMLVIPVPAAAADTYPSKPIRLVVPFTPGGPSDILSRLLGQKLSEQVGQTVVIDNRPGAGGNLGGEIVAKSQPDGYTLLMANNSILAANQSLYRKMPFDPTKDLVPVMWIESQPNILIVHPSLPAHTVKELIAYAKAHPGKLNYASSGFGAAAHLSAELFKSMTGTSMVHIPFKGAAPALTDVLAGRSQLMFATALSVLPYLRAGRLRPLAVTTSQRMQIMPKLPTVAEAGVPGFEASTWHGIAVVRGTPRAIVTRLNGELNRILEMPDVRERLISEGAQIHGGTPEQFTAYIRSEIPKWAKVIKASGAHVD